MPSQIPALSSSSSLRLARRSAYLPYAVAACALFGIRNAARVAIVRLSAPVSSSRGPGGGPHPFAIAWPQRRTVARHRFAAWRDVDTAFALDGDWVGSPAVWGHRSRALRARERACNGRRARAPKYGLVVRPDHHKGVVDAVRSLLSPSGLEDGALVFGVCASSTRYGFAARWLFDREGV